MVFLFIWLKRLEKFMARADTVTLLSLDRFAQVVGIHPLHFNQVTVANLADVHICGSPYCQFAWQDADAVGREEIANAIKSAEEQITTELGFSPMPTWVADEPIMMPLPSNPELLSTSFRNVRGFWQSVHLNRGHVYTGGIVAKTLIKGDAPILYVDNDLDGYPELSLISVVTTVTDPEEIAVYYADMDGDDEWEIRPISVSIVGGTANIVIRREQLVIASLMSALNPEGVNGIDDANFVSTVDVYRKYNDPSQQLNMIWEPVYGDCSNTQFTVQTGFMMVRNKELGIVALAPGTWNSVDVKYDLGTFDLARQPNKGRVWYRAGWQYKGLWTKMDPMWEKAIAYYALTLLDRPLCSCNKIEAFVNYWREDFALSKSVGGTSFSWQKGRIIECPLGTTRGATYAWRLIQQYRSK